jgi:hypothetical protein
MEQVATRIQQQKRPHKRQNGTLPVARNPRERWLQLQGQFHKLNFILLLHFTDECGYLACVGVSKGSAVPSLGRA